jgi:hypothetical protein
MDMEPEKEINEVLNSFDGIKRAEPSPFLYNRILSRIDINVRPAPAKLIWLAAASFVLLIVLNFQALKTIRSFSGAKTEVQEIASGYQLLNTNSFNYNNN